jgi:hypothetical protein
MTIDWEWQQDYITEYPSGDMTIAKETGKRLLLFRPIRARGIDSNYFS